jgi:hypothetical protein
VLLRKIAFCEDARDVLFAVVFRLFLSFFNFFWLFCVSACIFVPIFPDCVDERNRAQPDTTQFCAKVPYTKAIAVRPMSGRKVAPVSSALMSHGAHVARRSSRWRSSLWRSCRERSCRWRSRRTTVFSTLEIGGE